MIKSLKNKKKKGFTLIEIIAVIAIIAILAAVLVPKVVGYMKEARKTEIIDQARKVVTAAESYGLKAEIDEATLGNKTIADIRTAAPDLLPAVSTPKIADATSVSTCKKILDSKHYTFDLKNDNSFNTVTALP